MDTRSLAYLGGGTLVAIIIVTLLGVPPAIWLTLVLGAAAVGMIVVVGLARADGVDVASRIMAQDPGMPDGDPVARRDETPVAAPDRAGSERAVEIELVRPADAATDAPAVWLHRRGGRRVHRFGTAGGWMVQQVSTKDPDNPRKRVIGESLTFASEVEAIRAADDLAQGIAPQAAARLEHPAMTTAEARA